MADVSGKDRGKRMSGDYSSYERAWVKDFDI